jgi:hypothetical protein
VIDQLGHVFVVVLGADFDVGALVHGGSK